jgi:hydroxymethylbilane synthase
MNLTKRKVVVATKRNELALAQCRQFLARLSLAHPHLELEELHVVTSGDKILDRPLAEIGGKGLFLKEIEEALLDGRADFAVHSLKDVPPDLPAGLVIGCVPAREDPRDVLVTERGVPFLELPRGSRVGTSSLRRGVQLKEARPDLEIVPIRGNVGTRIARCREGAVDATVLAKAGLNRLGLSDVPQETLEPSVCLPAVGQGALGIELRAEDLELAALLSVLEDRETAFCVAAERGVMTAVEGDCKTPVAAYAERSLDEIHLRALLANPDGSALRRREVRAPFPTARAEAFELGLRLGEALRAAVS